MSKIKLDMHSHFISFYIRLKLIVTEYKILLKCSVLIKCIVLLYFLLAFLIFSLSQFDQNAFLYVSIIFVILNDYQETVFSLFLIQSIVFFIRFFVNCKK